MCQKSSSSKILTLDWVHYTLTLKGRHFQTV
jgi:hypothetical protein